MAVTGTAVSSRLLIDAEVEALLSVHRGWCAKDRLREQPRIPFVRIGRSIRYRPEDFEAFVTSNIKATVA